MLTRHEIKISMDGKGRWADNIYIERLWRSVKQELVKLHRFETVSEARLAIAQYIQFYNTIRPHQSLGYFVPDYVYKEFKNVKNNNKKFEISSSRFKTVNNSQIFPTFLS